MQARPGPPSRRTAPNGRPGTSPTAARPRVNGASENLIGNVDPHRTHLPLGLPVHGCAAGSPPRVGPPHQKRALRAPAHPARAPENRRCPGQAPPEGRPRLRWQVSPPASPGRHPLPESARAPNRTSHRGLAAILGRRGPDGPVCTGTPCHPYSHAPRRLDTLNFPQPWLPIEVSHGGAHLRAGGGRALPCVLSARKRRAWIRQSGSGAPVPGVVVFRRRNRRNPGGPASGRHRSAWLPVHSRVDSRQRSRPIRRRHGLLTLPADHRQPYHLGTQVLLAESSS